MGFGFWGCIFSLFFTEIYFEFKTISIKTLIFYEGNMSEKKHLNPLLTSATKESNSN